MQTSGDGQILIFSGVRGDTRRYRTLHLYEQLRLAGLDCVVSHLTDAQLPGQIQNARAVILHRVAYDGYVARLLDQLRSRGALIVLDADDFLYDPAIMRWIDSPDFQDPVRAGLYRKELLRHRATLDHCDAITVSTASLAHMMEPFGKPVRVHRNAFSLELLALSQQAAVSRSHPADRVVLGYASGTRTHDKDFNMVQPALCEVMSRHPQVELWLLGDIDPGDTWGALRARVKTLPRVPWRNLPERLAMLDINLAPLVPESPFNQAKSEIKFMEAALVGVPTIASPTDAFSFAVHSGENGYLASNLEEWQSAVETLVCDAAQREATGAAAYRDVLSRYAPWVSGPAMAQTLAELAQLAGKHALVPYTSSPVLAPDQALMSQFYFTPADEEHPTMQELARYSILHRGPGTLLGQVWVYFRRKIAPVFPFRSAGSV
jgi:glycosyltransferase involved in cell wall biosynthesis